MSTAMQTRRSTRSATASGAASLEVVPTFAAAAPAKRATKKKTVLGDCTNVALNALNVPMAVASAEPVKAAATEITMEWDVDALTAEKDNENMPPVSVAAVAVPITATAVVPAQPQLLCAQIDPSILALKVTRAPLPAFVAAPIVHAYGYDSDDGEEIVPSSRRVQMVYSAAGDLIGAQDVAPLALTHDDEEDEEALEDLAELGAVERMSASDEAFVAPTPLFDHASPILSAEVSGSAAYTSGFLPAGLVSSSAVRSVKLDGFESAAPLPSYLFAAPASTQANVEKVTGFVSHIDVNRVQSKKL